MSPKVEPVAPADAIRARVPEVLRAWQDARHNVLGDGAVEPELKLLCARYFAGDPDLADFAGAERFNQRQRAALGWAEAIAWNPELADDALWERLHASFSEPELAELGYSLALLRGQVQWLRVLGLEPRGDDLAEI